MPERRGVPLWWWWIPFVLVVSAPSFGFTTEAQWDRLHLLPFSDPEDKPRDVVTNVLLFVPFGSSYFKHRQGRGRLAATLGVAIAVSALAEATQLFSSVRNPSATDVTMAAFGAGMGAAVRWLWERRGAPPASSPGPAGYL